MDEDDELAALRQRVVDLEMRTIFQERTIGALDGVVQQFAARVQRLEQEVRELRRRLPPADAEVPERLDPD